METREFLIGCEELYCDKDSRTKRLYSLSSEVFKTGLDKALSYFI